MENKYIKQDISQVDYNALEVKDSNTLYCIQMTNREWLQGLSDEELARFLTEGLLVTSTRWDGTPYFMNIRQIANNYMLSVFGIKEWLSKEQEFEVARED